MARRTAQAILEGRVVEEPTDSAYEKLVKDSQDLTYLLLEFPELKDVLEHGSKGIFYFAYEKGFDEVAVMQRNSRILRGTWTKHDQEKFMKLRHKKVA